MRDRNPCLPGCVHPEFHDEYHCPNAEPAPACFCGGRAVLGPIPQDGGDAEVQFVHATGCPKDVGPGSAWQREAEENGRRLAEPAPAPRNECLSTHKGWHCTLTNGHAGEHEAWSETMPITKPFAVWSTPAEAPKEEHYLSPEQAQARIDAVFARAAKPAPAPASVTPAATDEEIARAAAQGFVSYDTGMRLIARIESEKAANAELREEGQKLKTAIDDLKRTVTEASIRRHEEIASLRARLAEVSEAARAVVTTRNDRSVFDYEDLDVPITALEAILAKGDTQK